MYFEKAKDNECKREHKITARVTDDMDWQIKEIAEAKGQSVSDVVFDSLVATINRKNKMSKRHKKPKDTRCQNTPEFPTITLSIKVE